ncbi:MAG: VCBS repeat-containing protein [Myxococcales bacterium]|nr:VCBS repeat-containing protein [Myxococcales bacterium]
MVGPRLDPSLWNLSAPVALLTACGSLLACGPIVAEGDTDSGSASADSTDTSVMSATSPSTTSPSTTSPSTTSPSTTTPTGCVVDEDCPANYRCDNGTCYYNGYCYDECCDPDCGWYNECYYSFDCPTGSQCQYNLCYTLEPETICESVPFGIGFEIPVGTGVYSMAFIESDGNAERELLIGGSGVTLARIDGTTDLIDPDPFVYDLDVGDLDGDGDQDVVMADGQGNAPRVLFAGNGWTAEEVPAAAVTERVTLVDLDGDGIQEIVTSSGSDDSVVYQYGGPGSWASSYAWGPSYFVGSGSLDGDPFEDLLYSGLGVFATFGGFAFESMQLYNGAGNAFQRGAIGNFDGVGDLDVMVTESANGGTVASMWPGSVSQGNGWWSSWWPNPVDVTAAADINGDGFVDVVGGGATGLTIAYGGAEPDGIVCVSSVPTPYGAYVLAIGDMSGDGRLDIAISDGGTAYVMLRTD